MPQDSAPRRDRPADALRPIEVTTGFLERHPGSVLYASGRTRVLCTALIEPGVPPFLDPVESGWATAEYNLLPGATAPRYRRERGKVSGRTQEIQRLIGRALRAVLDLKRLSGVTLQIDCDVIEADGGTRTAAISGACIAAALTVDAAMREGQLTTSPLIGLVSAVSVGLHDGAPLVDLDQAEDSSADVDLNVAMTDTGGLVEVQGTAEGTPFTRAELDALMELAVRGNEAIQERQRAVLKKEGAWARLFGAPRK